MLYNGPLDLYCLKSLAPRNNLVVVLGCLGNKSAAQAGMLNGIVQKRLGR